MWPMVPLNNELESCWCQQLTEHITIILHPKFERKRIWGRYFMELCFFNKVVLFLLVAMLVWRKMILLQLRLVYRKYYSGNLLSRLLMTGDIPVATSKWSALVINSYCTVSETSEKPFPRNWKQFSVKHTCTNTMRCFIWHPMTG